MPSTQVVGATVAEIRRDVAAAQSRDPAAAGVGTIEILLAWPGVQALLAHRVANLLQRAGVPLVPRLIATVARSITGIEIHPAAKIGRGFFIDHGMGVVIGETAVVGDDVTLYQGVTLGGTSTERVKRHPTIEDNVVIGDGAKVLGNITVGKNCRIGAGSVVLRNVPENSTVVGVPGHIIFRNGERVVITDPKQINDPLSEALAAVANEVKELKQQVRELQGREFAPSDGDRLEEIIQIKLTAEEDAALKKSAEAVKELCAVIGV